MDSGLEQDLNRYVAEGCSKRRTFVVAMTTTVATSSLLSVDRSLARLTANFFAPSLKLDDQSLRKCSDSEGQRQMPRASDATKLRICSTFNESSRFIAFSYKFHVEVVVQELIALTWYCDSMIRWGIRAFYLYSTTSTHLASTSSGSLCGLHLVGKNVRRRVVQARR